MLDQDGEHIWKRLLLVARLIDALDPMVSVQALPSWSSTLATFTLHCLQIKGKLCVASAYLRDELKFLARPGTAYQNHILLILDYSHFTVFP